MSGRWIGLHSWVQSATVGETIEFPSTDTWQRTVGGVREFVG